MGRSSLGRSPLGRPLTDRSLVVGHHADGRASPSWSDAAAAAAISVNVGHGARSRRDRCSFERCPGDIVGFTVAIEIASAVVEVVRRSGLRTLPDHLKLIPHRSGLVDADHH